VSRYPTKVATSFFVVVFISELCLIFYLYQITMNLMIEEEYSRLLEYGANHRDVLVENYSPQTIRHIVLMEEEKDRDIIITDQTGEIIRSSENIKLLENNLPLVKEIKEEKDQMLISDWKTSPYLVSVHPYEVDETISGYVAMFLGTSSIHQMVKMINTHFAIAGASSLIILLMMYIVSLKLLARFTKREDVNE